MKYQNPDVSFSPEGIADDEIMYANPRFVAEMVEIAKTIKS
jgi:hypothetical protein